MPPLLEKVILGGEQAKAAVIWLHGLGADGYDFVSIVPQLNLPKQAEVRFVFPHAPLRPVTLNQGAIMRAWYDILQINARTEEDSPGIQAAEKFIHELIAEQVQLGIPSQKIILAGFSQGGAVALYTGLRFNQPLAGILALSTYLPLPHLLAEEKHPVNQAIPIWIAHGFQDDVIPISIAKTALLHLKQQGYTPEWQMFEMGHHTCPEEINQIGAWLRIRLL